MPVRLTLATDEERRLVVEAMRAAASTRSRAAAKAAAATMADKRNGADVRARAVKLVAMLAEAADLERLAAELEGTPDLPLVERTPEPLKAVPNTITADEAGRALAEDVAQLEDGDAPELDVAHRAAEVDRIADLAGLKPAVLDGDVAPVEDELGVAAEDVPADDDVVAVTL